MTPDEIPLESAVPLIVTAWMLLGLVLMVADR